MGPGLTELIPTPYDAHSSEACCVKLGIAALLSPKPPNARAVSGAPVVASAHKRPLIGAQPTTYRCVAAESPRAGLVCRRSNVASAQQVTNYSGLEHMSTLISTLNLRPRNITIQYQVLTRKVTVLSWHHQAVSRSTEQSERPRKFAIYGVFYCLFASRRLIALIRPRRQPAAHAHAPPSRCRSRRRKPVYACANRLARPGSLKIDAAARRLPA